MIFSDIERLEREYAYSNAASQIYKSYIQNEEIKALSKQITPEEVIDEFHLRVDKNEKSLEDVAIAYALILMATFYEYEKAISTFSKLELSKLKWGLELEDIFRRGARMTIYQLTNGKAALLKESINVEITSVATVQGKSKINEIDQTSSGTSGLIIFKEF